ncbi:MAG TPA: hypothetical protein VKS24_25100 [Bradyrhizobium sp.]|nr:hypothetical protein [Bradyrhizobium sp.]
MADQPSASLTTTAIGGLTIATVLPFVDWAWTGFHGAPPDSLKGLVAGGILFLGHAVQKGIVAWLGTRKTPAAEALLQAIETVPAPAPVPTVSPLPTPPAIVVNPAGVIATLQMQGQNS